MGHLPIKCICINSLHILLEILTYFIWLLSTDSIFYNDKANGQCIKPYGKKVTVYFLLEGSVYILFSNVISEAEFVLLLWTLRRSIRLVALKHYFNGFKTIKNFLDRRKFQITQGLIAV